MSDPAPLLDLPAVVAAVLRGTGTRRLTVLTARVLDGYAAAGRPADVHPREARHALEQAIAAERGPDLFGEIEQVPAPLSGDERRTQRQAQAIALGLHPLSLVIPNVWLHPDADHNATRTDPPNLPLRCGSCMFRQVARYPKCFYGYGRAATNRQTCGAGTDVRAWWPACTQYVKTGE